MKRLGDRVVELERMVQSSRLYLEDIAHKLDKTGKLTWLIRVVELERMVQSSRLYLEDIAPKLDKTGKFVCKQLWELRYWENQQHVF